MRKNETMSILVYSYSPQKTGFKFNDTVCGDVLGCMYSDASNKKVIFRFVQKCGMYDYTTYPWTLQCHWKCHDDPQEFGQPSLSDKPTIEGNWTN